MYKCINHKYDSIKKTCFGGKIFVIQIKQTLNHSLRLVLSSKRFQYKKCCENKLLPAILNSVNLNNFSFKTNIFLIVILSKTFKLVESLKVKMTCVCQYLC